MIIKEIRIKNFRSYYGDNNRFEFSDGLTLILGDNGDGKTTFFEALQWMFDTTKDKGSIDNISEMRKSKMEAGETDEVSVSMSFDHDGEKFVEKSFTVECGIDGNFRVGTLVYRGYETNGAERIQVSGKQLIDRCYDAFIQRFSMFKGESDLNVFDKAEALKQLVDKYSDISKFDNLVEMTTSFAEKSNAAYLKEVKSDTKVSSQAKSLDEEITKLSNSISDRRREIKEKNDSIGFYSSKLSELEASQETSQRFKDIQSRLKTQEEKKNKLNGLIHGVDYNHALLDKYWILCAFMPILQEFKQKCSALSKEKRKQDKDYERQKAIEIGKIEAVKEMQGVLVNGATGLPWYLPTQETMEEMLHDHICKVCGRPAEEGSEAYLFMVNKLEQYRRHIELKAPQESQKEAIEQKELFPNSFVEELHNLSMQLSGSREAEVSRIPLDISDRRDFVDSRKQELKDVEQKLEDIKDERSRLLIQANVSEEVLEKEFNDIKGLFEQKGKDEVRLVELNKEIENLQQRMADLQAQMDELNPDSSQVKVYRESHRILEEIARAFATAKKKNLYRFLTELQDKSNEYLARLSSDDFHGEVQLVQTFEDSTEIRLFSSNGTEIKKPSGSQKTVMYISVLFAISDFTQEKRSEDYPLIFDAATSSFGDAKEQGFYNVIDKLNKQCIIVTKDFIEKGNVRMSDIERLTCSVYRIRKAQGFDARNMATIRTIIEKIK